jgi:FkbM family methyltransferase
MNGLKYEIMETLDDVQQWFADDGDNTHRFNYVLTPDSVVFDVGGYKGDFTQGIVDRFHCNVFCFEPVKEFFDQISKRFQSTPKVFVYNCAILDSKRIGAIYINKDESNMYLKEGKRQSIVVIPFWEAMGIAKVKQVDLLKINIEGGEYPLLAAMLLSKQVEKCRNIQVQFHKVPEYQEQYDTIAGELSKTHHLTYRYPFVWENWERKLVWN